MMTMGGCDQEREKGCGAKLGKEDVVWQVRVLSLVLLRAGWNREDVMYSLDLEDREDNIIGCCVGKFPLDFQLPSTSSSCSRQDDDHQNSNEAAEASKWEKITYLGIATCTILAFYNLSKGHPHHEEHPPYQYLHIRNKEFPWGPYGLFEKKHH
ncbi:hypothetical protein GH714_033555 [Hevea brasiliensis]|uniref:Cytochrome c oxidase subunit 6a n=1 Tax=Hevea brasiliensis TaxID=3981 RepID=A0A6A6L4V3_HEVBR|nr:hypothetical protein GH714_033555 [Hevea brasiliensis]